MKLVCAGDCGIDRYVDGQVERPGGSALNFAVAALRQAQKNPSGCVEVSIRTMMSDHSDAIWVEDCLKRMEIPLQGEMVSGALPIRWIDLSCEDKEGSLNYSPGLLENQIMPASTFSDLTSEDWVFTSCHSQTIPFFESVVLPEKKRAPYGIAVDFLDLGSLENPLKFVEKMTPYVDVGFFGLNWKNTDWISSLGAIAHENEKLFVVTLGSEGSLILGGWNKASLPRGGRHHIAQNITQILDSTGAGAAFGGTLLAGLLGGIELVDAQREATLAGARATQHLGAFPYPERPMSASH